MPGWEEIKNHRDGLEYDRLCNMNTQQSEIQCLLLDNGLQGVQEMANRSSWHRRFANNSVYRLVRIEPVAEVRARLEIECPKDLRMALTVWLKDVLQSLSPTDPNAFEAFSSAFSTTLTDLARDPVVVVFKSVVCYRTGLNVWVDPEDLSNVERRVVATVSSWKDGRDRMCSAKRTRHLMSCAATPKSSKRQARSRTGCESMIKTAMMRKTKWQLE